MSATPACVSRDRSPLRCDGRDASSGLGAAVYARHRPERTLLYALVQEYYPAFKVHLAAQGRALPGYVEQAFEDYLKCGRLEQGFLRVRCESCHAEHLVAFSCYPQRETIKSPRPRVRYL